MLGELSLQGKGHHAAQVFKASRWPKELSQRSVGHPVVIIRRPAVRTQDESN